MLTTRIFRQRVENLFRILGGEAAEALRRSASYSCAWFQRRRAASSEPSCSAAGEGGVEISLATGSGPSDAESSSLLRGRATTELRCKAEQKTTSQHADESCNEPQQCSITALACNILPATTHSNLSIGRVVSMPSAGTRA